MAYGIVLLVLLAGIFCAGALVYRKHVKEAEETISKLKKYIADLHKETLKK